MIASCDVCGSPCNPTSHPAERLCHRCYRVAHPLLCACGCGKFVPPFQHARYISSHSPAYKIKKTVKPDPSLAPEARAARWSKARADIMSRVDPITHKYRNK